MYEMCIKNGDDGWEEDDGNTGDETYPFGS